MSDGDDPRPIKLARMANQIAAAFAGQREADPAERAAQHIRDFWSPDMRAAFAVHVAGGGAGLTPLAREAAARL